MTDDHRIAPPGGLTPPGQAAPLGAPPAGAYPDPFGRPGDVVWREPRPVVDGVFTQSEPSDTWVIEHGLGRHPAVVTVDAEGSVFEGAVRYHSASVVVVELNAPVAGAAYLY